MANVLEGLKVLDFTMLLPGPFATLYLSDMGAQVLRVVSRSKADFIQSAPPFIPGTDVFAGAAQLHRNKRCLYLNLKDSRATEIVHRLIDTYDIVIESFRPGVMSKFNLDYDSLKKKNPALIYCSLTGYGQSGPMKLKSGHDINFLAQSGIASYSGKKQTGPCLGGLQTDLASGSTHAVMGILAAVIYRHSTGIGQHIDISITDSMIAFTALYGAASLIDGIDPELEGGLSNGGSLYDYYLTQDGRYIAFGGIEAKFFENFCEVIHRPDLLKEGIFPRNIKKTKNEVRDIFITKTRDEWIGLFNATDACVEPVFTISEVFSDRLALEREMAVNLPMENGKTVKQIANPIKFSDTQPTYKNNDFCIQSGDQTPEICEEIGFSKKEIDLFQKTSLFD